jgi:hypothetical protein
MLETCPFLKTRLELEDRVVREYPRLPRRSLQRHTGNPATFPPETDIPIPCPMQNATLLTSRLSKQLLGVGMRDSCPFHARPQNTWCSLAGIG